MSDERLSIPISVGIIHEPGSEVEWSGVILHIDPQHKDIRRFAETIAIEVVKILRTCESNQSK